MKEIESFIENMKSDSRIHNFDEAATKQAIVLRLLTILGWNTFDIDEVTPEYSVGVQKVDYSLRLNHKNKVFIEVKRISEELEYHQEQLLNYAFQEGVKIAVLTNGISWWFYLPLNEGSWEQRKFYAIDLLQQDPEDISKKFSDLLYRDNVLSSKAIENAETIYKGHQKTYIVKKTIPIAWNRIVSEPDELLIELLIEHIEKLSGFRTDSNLVEKFITDNSERLILTEITSEKTKKYTTTRKTVITISGEYVGKKITSFSLFNNSYPVKNWRDLLITLIDIIHTQNADKFDKVLSLVGRKRPYFTYNANELREPLNIKGTSIYVESNLSASGIVKLCQRILNVFGYKPEILELHTD